MRMRRNEKHTLINTWLLAGISVLLIVVIILAVWLIIELRSLNMVSDETNPDLITEQKSHDTSSDTTGFENVSDEKMEIETPYVSLEFPAHWSDYLVHSGSSDGEMYVHTFKFSSNGKEEELFTVYFGVPDLGSLIGYLEHEGKEVSFSVETVPAIDENGYTEEDLVIYGYMQEAVNDVINSVTSAEGFRKA